MDWAEHDEWACRIGVSKEVSGEVNTIIDAVEQGEKIPEEYREVIDRCAEKWTAENAPNSKSATGIVISNYSARCHDAGRNSKTGGDVAAEVLQCAMGELGEDYITAWYLHHHLDFLTENWGDGASLDVLMEEYKEEYPLTHSSEIEELLRGHKESLQRDLDRHRA